MTEAERQAAEEAERTRRQQQQDAQAQELARQASGEENPLSGIMQAIFGFLQALMAMLTGEETGDGDRSIDAPPGASPDSPRGREDRGDGASLFNNIRASAQAATVWARFQRENAGETVNHTSPMRGESLVNDDRHMRERHPVHGDRRMHHGIDMVPRGSDRSPDILASADGVVLRSGWLNGYGQTVIVGHADGTYTLYAHMTGNQMPRAGSVVSQGDVIGEMGATGGVTGPHLHYEQRRGRESFDPRIAGREVAENQRLMSGNIPSLAAVGVGGDSGERTAPATGGSRRYEVS